MGKQLFVEVRYQVKEGMREVFLQKIKEAGIAEATRREAGNSRYEYFYSVDDSDKLLLLEVWDTAEDQRKHAETQHYKGLTELKKEYVIDTQLIMSIIEPEVR